MTKRFAFTLAEVLIALAIIGVVAAMTIPTFMANTAGAQFRTGFKKGITVLTQAASANYATEGYDFSGTNGYYGAKDTPDATYDGTPATDGAVIGFNTSSIAGADTFKDLHGDTPSLFHLFQNNLNMKNSNEVANYAVMPADAALNCTGQTSLTISVPGTTVTSATLDADLTKRQAGNSSTTVEGTTTTTYTVQGGGGLADLCAGRSLGENGNGGFNQGRMFQLEDGMTFTYDPSQAYCSESNPCYGYIDVNGPTGPNRLISCSAETTKKVGEATENVTYNKNGWISTYGRNADPGMLLADCTVEAKDITDIYPVLFYGSAVKPASIAAKSVLYSKKSNQAAGGS